MRSADPDAVPNEVLRNARLAANLTQEEAARRAGYASKTGWAMVELGLATPPPKRMKAIANAVGRSVRDLFPLVAELDDLPKAPVVATEDGSGA